MNDQQDFSSSLYGKKKKKNVIVRVEKAPANGQAKRRTLDGKG